MTLQRHQIIFYALANNLKPMTSNSLAQRLNVSSRTIKSDMKHVAFLAQKNGAQLHAKQGLGYWLDIINQAVFTAAIDQLKLRYSYLMEMFMTDNQEHSIVMQYLIAHDNYFKIEQVAEHFYLPKTTMNEIIKQFKKIIAPYELKLESKPNFGTRIVGPEFNKRLVMLMFFEGHFHKIEFDHIIKDFYAYFESDIEELTIARDILLTALKEKQYPIHDSYTQCLSRYLVLQRKRNQSGYMVTFAPEKEVLLSEFHETVELATTILNQLGNLYHETVTTSDISGLALLLLLWRDITIETDLTQTHKPIVNHINHISTLYLQALQPYLHLDIPLQQNYETYFKARITPLIMHQVFGCTELDIKRGSAISERTTPLATAFAYTFFELMYQQFNVHYSLSLIRHFTCDVAIILTRNQSIQRINILISSLDGIEAARNIEQALRARYHDNFFGEIRLIELYEGHTIPFADFDLIILDNLDYIFYAYEWPIITIHTETFTEDIKQVFDAIQSLSAQKDSLYYQTLKSFTITTQTTPNLPTTKPLLTFQNITTIHLDSTLPPQTLVITFFTAPPTMLKVKIAINPQLHSPSQIRAVDTLLENTIKDIHKL